MTDKNRQFGKRFLSQWFRKIFLIPWLFFAAPIVGVCHSSQIEVRIDNNAVEVIARQAPLIDVISELSGKARFHLIADGAMDQVVTLNIHSATVEDCIRQLVAGRNHAMYYKRLADGRIVLTEVKIIDNQIPMRQSPSTSMQNKEVEQLRFDPETYINAISDRTALSKQLKAERMHYPAGEHPPGKGGIQVSEVALDSLFSRIGIAKGDIITNVNGTDVTSGRAFLDAMRWTPGSPSAIRIERFKQGGHLDPIYIYVESN